MFYFSLNGDDESKITDHIGKTKQQNKKALSLRICDFSSVIMEKVRNIPFLRYTEFKQNLIRFNGIAHYSKTKHKYNCKVSPEVSLE